MDELEQLRELRADLRAPGEERLSKARGELDRVIAEERSPAMPRRARASTPKPGWRRRLAGASVVAALGLAVALAVVLSSGGDGGVPSERTDASSLRDVAAELQSNVHLDFDHLDDLGLTLRDVAAGAGTAPRFGAYRVEANVIGIGRVIDVRLAYKEADGLQHMVVVIEPDQTTADGDLLGESGEVLVDEIAPPVDRETGSRGIAELREAFVSAPERVAFMLAPVPAEAMGNPDDQYAGRSADDPLLRPAHPSSFFGLDESARVAFPLTTDEKLEDVPGNLDPLRELGADIDRFARSDAPLGGAQ